MIMTYEEAKAALTEYRVAYRAVYAVHEDAAYAYAAFSPYDALDWAAAAADAVEAALGTVTVLA